MDLLAAQNAPLVPPALAWVMAFLFGLNVGSFLNVVAHRLPMGLSVVRPRSRCPACRTPIGALDNIPVVSWLLLGGRCRGCKSRISPRYAAVEVLTGVVAVLVVQFLVVAPGGLGDASRWIHAGAVFLVAAALLAASLVDLDHTILPDEITIRGMWIAPVVAALVPELTLTAMPDTAAQLTAHMPSRLAAALLSVAGIAVGAGVVWIVRAVGSAIAGKEAMGFGDVKFHGMIGGFVGPAGALLAFLFGCVVGAVVGLVRTLFTKERYLPFGPYLAIGGIAVMLRGPQFLAWYVSLMRV